MIESQAPETQFQSQSRRKEVAPIGSMRGSVVSLADRLGLRSSTRNKPEKVAIFQKETDMSVLEEEDEDRIVVPATPPHKVANQLKNVPERSEGLVNDKYGKSVADTKKLSLPSKRPSFEANILLTEETTAASSPAKKRRTKTEVAETNEREIQLAIQKQIGDREKDKQEEVRALKSATIISNEQYTTVRKVALVKKSGAQFAQVGPSPGISLTVSRFSLVNQKKFIKGGSRAANSIPVKPKRKPIALALNGDDDFMGHNVMRQTKLKPRKPNKGPNWDMFSSSDEDH